MTLDQLLERLRTLPDLPADIRQAAWEHQKAQDDRQWRARTLAYTGPTIDDYSVNGRPWRTRSVGVAALAHAVRNPDRWVTLPRGRRSIRAWHAAIRHAVEQLDEFDCGLADALKPRRERGPGTHLRSINDERGPAVQVRWTPGEIEVRP